VVELTSATTATVTARYTCTWSDNGEPAEPHLWVSVKQNLEATADPALMEEGAGFGAILTGQTAVKSWSQAHPEGQILCDGKSHVASFTVDQEEIGLGELRKGQAFVQFCLTGEGFVADQEFRRVRA